MVVTVLTNGMVVTTNGMMVTVVNDVIILSYVEVRKLEVFIHDGFAKIVTSGEGRWFRQDRTR